MRNPSGGVALVATLALLAVVAALVYGASFTARLEGLTARNDAAAALAHGVARVGLDKAKTLLHQSFRFALERPPDPSAPLGACDGPLAAGVDWNRDGSLGTDERVAVGENVLDALRGPLTRFGTVALGSGAGRYTYSVAAEWGRSRFISLRSVGEHPSSGARSTVQAVYYVAYLSPWEHAVFAGSGAGNRHLNGGGRVRGSFYVAGDPSLPGEVVLEASGNFSMLNDYDVTGYDGNGPNGLRVSQYVSPTQRQQADLCAALRVRHGQVNVQGSAAFGASANPLAGFYVGEGAPAGLPSCASGAGICAAEIGGFDLPPTAAPGLPTLDGSPCTASTGLSWRGCVRAEAERDGLRLVRHPFDGVQQPVLPAGATWNTGGATTNPRQCNTSAAGGLRSGQNGLLSGETLTLGLTSIDCSYTVNATGARGGFRYTANTGTTPSVLDVYGTVELVGLNLVLGRDTLYRAFGGGGPTLRGASIVVERYLDPSTGTAQDVGGHVEVNGLLRPDISNSAHANPYLRGRTFPDQVLALVAERDFYQRGAVVMGALYAGATYRTVQRNLTLGSVTANFFCTTSAGGQTGCNAGQGPEIVYVDMSAQRPPVLSLVGGARVPVFRALSYERR